MSVKVLLVNPPIYDFSAYDFWLKPYGLLRVGGFLRGKADIMLFDYLDRMHTSSARPEKIESDRWGRGKFEQGKIEKPAVFSYVPRYFRRFGTKREIFQRFLTEHGPFDFVLVGTGLTYWYPAVEEVIEDLRAIIPRAKIILGGIYATICSEHAKKLGADMVVIGNKLAVLGKMLGAGVFYRQRPYWEGYERLDTAVMTLTQGCPFRCSYCYVGQEPENFKTKRFSDCIADLQLLIETGARNIAFYDDALLYESGRVLEPFLRYVIDNNIRVNFHAPNALHARFLTTELAELMVAAGFKTFYLGFESASKTWQEKTGGKVFCDDLKKAVENLITAGAERNSITVYEMLGHPHGDLQRLEESMRFVNGLGVRIMLADFSPIPGTPDGEYCRRWVDMDEPLNHNKTAFTIKILGADEANRFKELCRKLNGSL
jgi:radical SAM superfamily enzyme YgiQ (UPF0313 family)